MKITKNKVMSLIAILIILIIYNVIAFIVPFTRSGAFRVGYSFSMLSILLTAGVGFYTLNHEDIKSKFYGLPLLRVVWIYLIIQIILGFIFMAESAIPTWVAVVISIIFLGACLVGLITVNMGKEEIERIDKVVKEKVFYIKSLQTDVECLQEKTDDPELKISLKDLLETIKYSDPMNSALLDTIEVKIEAKITELSEDIATGKIEESKDLCRTLQQLFIERNKKCKLLK